MNTNNTQGLKIYEYKRHLSSQGSKTGSVSDLDYNYIIIIPNLFFFLKLESFQIGHMQNNNKKFWEKDLHTYLCNNLELKSHFCLLNWRLYGLLGISTIMELENIILLPS